jgi:hypothetical protein
MMDGLIQTWNARTLTLNLDYYFARKPWTAVVVSFYHHPVVTVPVVVPAAAARRQNTRILIP